MHPSLHVQLRVIAFSMGLTTGQMLYWQLSAQSGSLYVTAANIHVYIT